MNRPLRIAHISLGLDMGGLEKLLVAFARHADRERFELRFISLGSRGVLADEIEDLGWPVTALNRPAGLRPGLVPYLAWHFRRWGVDVVHTHNERPLLYGAAAASVARIRRLIHTRHGRSVGMTPRQQKTISVASRLVDQFVCVSRDCAQLSTDQAIKAPIRTIWNGIDPSTFAFQEARHDGPAVVVARLSPEKGLETLLRAMALAIVRDPALTLEIAGDGPCRSDLESLVSSLGIGPHVRFLGLVHDVPALLARARFFVLPSLSEGISLTLLEAMASGLAVVSTRVGGTPEIVVEDGSAENLDGTASTGVLVPAGNPVALADAMLRVLDDFRLRQTMGEAARRRVERCFDIRTMVASYELLYSEKATKAPGLPFRPNVVHAGEASS